MNQPPLKMLHRDSFLSQVKLDQFAKMSNEELVESLRPGQRGALKVKHDGIMMDGHL